MRLNQIQFIFTFMEYKLGIKIFINGMFIDFIFTNNLTTLWKIIPENRIETVFIVYFDFEIHCKIEYQAWAKIFNNLLHNSEILKQTLRKHYEEQDDTK